MPSRRRNDVQASRSVLQIARTIVAERVRNVVARNRRELRLTDSEVFFLVIFDLKMSWC